MPHSKLAHPEAGGGADDHPVAVWRAPGFDSDDEGFAMNVRTPPARPATVKCPFCGTLNRVDLARVADLPKCGECKRPIRLDRPLSVDAASFDRVLADTSVPVLVDFYADWCAPCRIMAPMLDEVAHERTGEILVLKLDTDANPTLSQRFGIRGIPTLIAFRGGRESGREVGVVDLTRIRKLVE